MTTQTRFFVVVPLALIKTIFFAHCHHAAIGSKACFSLQLHTLSPLPVALPPSLAAGGSSLLGCFCRQLHTLSPMSAPLSPSLAVGCYGLLGLFLATVAHVEPSAKGAAAFILVSFLHVALFWDHLGITLGSFWDHVGIILAFGIISDNLGIALGLF